MTATIESALRKAVAYEKINYLMLMMVDAEVHFHVIPRYAGTREWQGREFVDVGWPKLPDLGHAVALGGDERADLVNWLKQAFA